MEAVRNLEQTARTRGYRLSMEEIRDHFSDLHLEEEQYDFIGKYYEARNITILKDGDRGEDRIMEEVIEVKEDPMDEEMVSAYKMRTGSLSRIPEDQMERVARKLSKGDENARNLLIESNLAFALEIAGEYKGKGLPLSDLIQESNIGLMMAVNDFEPGIHGRFRKYAEGVIRSHIEEALTEYNQSTRSAMKVASRVNELNRLATAFAREYEREASPHELAERLGISEEEVRQLMKISLDAIAVLDEGKIGK